MNQITIEILSKYLKENSINLNSTHARLCYSIINRIYKKMCFGIKFQSIKVDGNLIIDGHHRYLASLLSGVTLDTIPSTKTSATVL